MNASGLVYVVDDDPSIRQSLSRLLGARGYTTAVYASADEYLLATRLDVPSCLVLDIGMPGPSGLDLQAELAKREPRLPIIFLTGLGDVTMSVHAMKAGAIDFLTKPVQALVLLDAVATALARDCAQRAARAQQTLLLERFGRLTGREREVFFQVTEGRLNKQIATDLGISERTIKAHRAQIMDKMSIRSLAQLVRAADRIRTTPLPLDVKKAHDAARSGDEGWPEMQKPSHPGPIRPVS